MSLQFSVVVIRTTAFNFNRRFIFCTECIYVFRVTYTIYSDYFKKQNYPLVFTVKMGYIYCAVGNECVDKIWINFNLEIDWSFQL
jgi:hypothetical protein